MRYWFVLWAVVMAGSAAAQISGSTNAENETTNEGRFSTVEGIRPASHPGAELFQQHCASCHLNMVSHAPHKNMLELLSPESIIASLTDGSMQQQGADLTLEDKTQLAEYLSSTEMGIDEHTELMCEAGQSAFDFDDFPGWKGWGINHSNTRNISSSQAAISKNNVAKLKFKWAFGFPNSSRVRSQPTPAGGGLFVGSHNGAVYFLDRETGCVRWKFQASAEVRTGLVISHWQQGDTSASPILYFGDFLGNLYAVKALTGDLLWRTRVDSHPSATITGTPVLFENRVFVPVSSLEVISAANPQFSCCTFSGSIVSVDADTGEQIWKTYTIEEEAKVIGKNPIGTENLGPAGAPVWNSPSIDEKRRLLFFGTGENYMSPATTTSDAIFAVSVDSGAVHWVYQATVGDAFNVSCLVKDKLNCPEEDGPDTDFGAATLLAPDARAGSGLVIGGQKSGVVHALDPVTGKLVWKTRVGRGGIVGGVHFGMARHQDKLFVPISDTPDGNIHDMPDRPGLFALDIQTGKEIWAAPMENSCEGREFCYPGISAAITATPELVFAGGTDGIVRAYSAEDGNILWQDFTAKSYLTLSGVEGRGGSVSGGAGPIPYKGMLFVSSGYSFANLAGGNVLIAYGIEAEEE